MTAHSGRDVSQLRGRDVSQLRGRDVSQLRSLLTHEDVIVRQQGLALALSFDDWSSVVDGCAICQDGSISVPFGTLTTELLQLLLTAPNFDGSQVEALHLSNLHVQESSCLRSLSALSNIKSLTISFDDPVSDFQPNDAVWTWLQGPQTADEDDPFSRFMTQASLSLAAKSFGTEISPECFYFPSKGVVVTHTTWSKMGMNLGWSNLEDLRHDLSLDDGLERSTHLDDYDFFYSDSQYAEFESFEWEQPAGVYFDWEDIQSQADEDGYDLFDYCLEFGDTPPSECPCPSSEYLPDRRRIYELSLQWRLED